MTEAQARALLAAADALPQEIGGMYTFGPGGIPCCAIGHLAHGLGYVPRGGNRFGGELAVASAYGLDGGHVDRIEGVNDDAPSWCRRAAVIGTVERIIGQHGYDVAALRAEVAGDAGR